MISPSENGSRKKPAGLDLPCAEELIAAYERAAERAVAKSLSPYRDRAGMMAYLGGVSWTTLHRAIAAGRLKVEHIGDKPICHVKELERFVKSDSRKNKQKRKETAQ